MRKRRRNSPNSTLQAWFETVPEGDEIPPEEKPTRAQLAVAAAWGLVQGLVIAALIVGGLWFLFFVVLRGLVGR